MFSRTVAMMGIADAIYSKGKRAPKWATDEEKQLYNLGFKYGKAQLR